MKGIELSHKNLDVWKFSLDLIEKIYSLTNSFPREELFGLIGQLRRAAISVTSNLSEGLSRSSAAEKCRFLEIARSSVVEIDSQLIISERLGYCSENDLSQINTLLKSVFAMTTALIKKIRK